MKDINPKLNTEVKCMYCEDICTGLQTG